MFLLLINMWFLSPSIQADPLIVDTVESAKASGKTWVGLTTSMLLWSYFSTPSLLMKVVKIFSSSPAMISKAALAGLLEKANDNSNFPLVIYFAGFFQNHFFWVILGHLKLVCDAFFLCAVVFICFLCSLSEALLWLAALWLTETTLRRLACWMKAWRYMVGKMWSLESG